VDFGYEDAVMLIVPVHVEASLAAHESARLGAEVTVLVCREMCIPGKAQLWLTLPIKSEPPLPDARTMVQFTATRKSLPRPVPGNWRFSLDNRDDSFVLTANLGHPIKQAIFFPLAESQIDNGAPQRLVPVTAGFRLTLEKSDQLLKPIERLKGVLVLSADRAYLIDVPLSKPGAARKNYSLGIHPAQSWRRDYKDEACGSIPDARCSGALHGYATALGYEGRRGGAGVHSYGKQWQNLSPFGLSRKVCGPRVAQQRVSLRAETVQQRQHAAATKAVDRPGRRLVHDSLLRAGQTGVRDRERGERLPGEDAGCADRCTA
jgi:hypothetical protein